MQALVRALGSKEKAREAVEKAAQGLGGTQVRTDPTVVALALCGAGVRPEEVSKYLTWREFEGFCSAVLGTCGFLVKENLQLVRPRAQIDLVAYGPSAILSVDCKHWERAHPPSALSKFAAAQLRRSSLLRTKIEDPRKIWSVILSFSEPEGRFVDGVAVVPVRTLPSFLSSFESYSALFRLL
jgi:hypothetical protein